MNTYANHLGIKVSHKKNCKKLISSYRLNFKRNQRFRESRGISEIMRKFIKKVIYKKFKLKYFAFNQ